MATASPPRSKSWQTVPEGTVRPAWGGKLWVVGRGGCYLYDPERGTCGCPDFLHRKKPGDRCRHRAFVEAHLYLSEQVERRQNETIRSDAELRRLFS